MARRFIGVLVSADGEIVAVINPDDDEELDNERLLEIGGGGLLRMLRLDRGEYEGALSPDDVKAIVDRLRGET